MEKKIMKRFKTATLTEAAMMIAAAFVLSLVPLPGMSMGGNISFAATLPIVLMSFRHGAKWGFVTASVYAVLQAALGIQNILLCKTMLAMLLCFLLDYYLAYAILGFCYAIARLFKKAVVGIIVAVVATGLLRLLLSFLSGIILWGQYAPEGTPVWQYSLIYNASWALPDTAIVLVALLIIYKLQPKIVLG